MDKLKTLKDIETKRLVGIELGLLDFYREKIRQEAINWIKMASEKKQPHELRIYDYLTIRDSFMYFFNITEKELNNG